MKTKLIIIPFLILVAGISCFVFAGAKPNSESNEGSQVVLVRVNQVALAKQCSIKIYYGSSRIEKIDLTSYGWDREEENFEKIVTVLNRLYAEGYALNSSSESISDYGVSHTFIFQKN